MEKKRKKLLVIFANSLFCTRTSLYYSWPQYKVIVFLLVFFLTNDIYYQLIVGEFFKRYKDHSSKFYFF